MDKYKIYSLKEPSTDIVKYIGITGRTLHARLRDHITEKGSAPKHNWMKRLKNQSLNPEIELLEDGLSLKDALKKEREYILLFKSVGAPLKNLTLGGEGVFGYSRTQEQKDHLSAIHKGAWSGSKNPMFGKTMDPQHKERLRIINKTKVCSQKTRNLRRIAITGRKASQTEIDNKIKSAKRGQDNKSAKLTSEKVIDIRMLKRDFGFSNQMLGEFYNVSSGCIGRIVNRKSWSHI